MTKQERYTRDAELKATAIERIMECFLASTAEERKQGAWWYPKAYTVAKELWPDDPRIGAGVIAALSPRCSWAKNVDGAREMVRVFKEGHADAPIVAGLGASRAKAWKILHGEWFESPVECLNSADGVSYKVNRFYANILGDLTRCTIDVWAARVAIPDAPEVVNGPLYLLVEQAYQEAAARLSRTGHHITPRDLQAVCWIHTRGTTGQAKNDAKATPKVRSRARAARPVEGAAVRKALAGFAGKPLCGLCGGNGKGIRRGRIVTCTRCDGDGLERVTHPRILASHG